jgi:2,4-dienoyl-CoA reductase-like NADH-dependent reductase (Old Yellow Enzyme family)
MNTLSTPGRIGSLILRSRLIGTIDVEYGLNGKGRLSADSLSACREQVREGPGLIVAGDFGVSPTGRAHSTMPVLDGNEDIGELQVLLRIAHAQGVGLVARLTHAARPVLTGKLSGIVAVVAAFGRAALRAEAAGFDGVEIDAARGGLIEQFLSTRSNRRTDRFGGDPESRMQMLLEVYKEIRHRVGGRFPVLVRIDLHHPEDDHTGACKSLDALGADAFSVGGDPPPRGTALRMLIKSLPFMKGRTGSPGNRILAMKRAVRAPVIVLAPDWTRAAMERVIASGSADFVAPVRPSAPPACRTRQDRFLHWTADGDQSDPA